MKLSRDYETRSLIDLKKAGAYRYAAHPTTSAFCVAYAIGDGQVDLWAEGDPIPQAFLDAKANGWETHAWNCAFERIIERYVMSPRHGFPEFDLRQQRCVMVAAKEMGLPAALELAAPAVGIKDGKDMAGNAVMKQMMRPRKVVMADGWGDIPFDAIRVQQMDVEGWEVYESPAGAHIARVQWWNDSERKAKLFAYCKQDVETERTVGSKIRALSATELAYWHHDQQINDRGILVDIGLADACARIVNDMGSRLDAEMAALTNYEVDKCSKVAAIIAHLEKFGVYTDSLAKDTLDEILERRDLNPHARQVLELRQEASMASVKKALSIGEAISPEDQTAKGLLQFFAAHTGRACLAEGALIATRLNGVVGETPIERVTTAHEVWDGTDWVAHEGVVFSGVKEVVEYDGLTATGDHRVYLSDDVSVPLREAVERGELLWRATSPS